MMAAHRSPSRAPGSIDLFAWPAVRDARERAEAAERSRLEALRRYRCAPHGHLGDRLRALQEASHQALRAALELAQTEREALQ